MIDFLEEMSSSSRCSVELKSEYLKCVSPRKFYLIFCALTKIRLLEGNVPALEMG